MPFNEIVNVLAPIYLSNPPLTLLRVVNLLISLFLANKLIGYAIKLKGKSLSYALRYLSYAFIIIALICVIQLLSVMPWFDWDVVEEIAFLLFLAISSYAILHLARTVEAYSHLRVR